MADERTKIVATLGPATTDPAVVRRLLDAGADVLRLNFSHGSAADHLARLATVRRVSQQARRTVGVLADLQGPKIRVGEVGEAGIELLPGEHATIVAGTTTAPAPAIPVVYERLAADVRAGDTILIDDGSIALTVRGVDGRRIDCEVAQGGLVRSRKGVNLPGVAVSAASLTPKDLADLETALRGGADYVALSFVRRAADVRECQAAIARLGADTPVVAKLERPEAIDDLDEILSATDAVMVARGDLGVELPVERVPALQKEIIARANSRGVPVITATQMLESMVSSPRPSRAEASDVANAIFDGTDAVMLSEETATGAFPVEAVATMSRIIREAESTEHLLHPPPPAVGALDVAATVAKAAVQIAEDLRAKVIVAYTESGATARLVSRFRPRTTIVGLTPHDATRRRMALYWGVRVGEAMGVTAAVGPMLALGDRRLVDGGWASTGDLVVVVAGTPGGRGATNRVIVHRVGEPERASAD